MRPNQHYRTVSGNRTTPSTPNRDTCIPLGNLTPVDMRSHSDRKGRAKQKIGMWGNLSPYYGNAVTIDSRWTQTTTDRGV